MTGRLLQAAGVTLAGVTVTDLGPGVTVTRIGIAGPGGTRPVTASLADGLTLAVITGAPLAVDNPVMDRLAKPVTGPDLLSQFRSQETPPGLCAGGSSPATWRSPTAWTTGSSAAPSCARAPGSTIPPPPKTGGRSWPRPCPSPPDSPSSPRKSTPTTTAAAPSPSAANCAPPRPTAAPGWHSAPPAQAGPRHPGQPAQIPGKTRPTTSPPPPEPATWTQYEVTAQIPADANLIRFGVFLNGGGQVELRHPELAPHPPGQQ